MKKCVIIGASAAGISAANHLARLDPNAQIICINAEAEDPYNKCFLADYVHSIKKENELYLAAVFNGTSRILLPSTRATAIDSHSRTVSTDDGRAIAYDTLLIATGSRPFIPPFIDTWHKGIFTFHSLADIKAILQYINKNNVKKITIIGAGLTGIECADALLAYNVELTIVERYHHIMSAFLDNDAANFLKEKIVGRSTIMVNQTVNKVYSKGNCIISVELSDNTCIDTDLLILSTGLIPNIELGVSAGIATDNRGIIVNDYLQTSVEDIYAAGDVISVTNNLTGTKIRSCIWADAMAQGMHAAYAIMQMPKKYPGVNLITTSSFFGLHFAHAGIQYPSMNTDILIIEQTEEMYYKLVLRDNRLIGFISIGKFNKSLTLKKFLLTQEEFTLKTLLL